MPLYALLPQKSQGPVDWPISINKRMSTITMTNISWYWLWTHTQFGTCCCSKPHLRVEIGDLWARSFPVEILTDNVTGFCSKCFGQFLKQMEHQALAAMCIYFYKEWHRWEMLQNCEKDHCKKAANNNGRSLLVKLHATKRHCSQLCLPIWHITTKSG